MCPTGWCQRRWSRPSVEHLPDIFRAAAKLPANIGLASICRTPIEHLPQISDSHPSVEHLSNIFRAAILPANIGLASICRTEHLSNICRAARVRPLNKQVLWRTNSTPQRRLTKNYSLSPSVEHLLPANIGSRELLSAKMVASICRRTSFGLGDCPQSGMSKGCKVACTYRTYYVGSHFGCGSPEPVRLLPVDLLESLTHGH